MQYQILRQASGVRTFIQVSSFLRKASRDKSLTRGSRGREPEAFYFFLPLSSAIYMISCLKINRLGAPSRVSRTMFLS
jgi:hypothetical protein